VAHPPRPRGERKPCGFKRASVGAGENHSGPPVQAKPRQAGISADWRPKHHGEVRIPDQAKEGKTGTKNVPLPMAMMYRPDRCALGDSCAARRAGPNSTFRALPSCPVKLLRISRPKVVRAHKTKHANGWRKGRATCAGVPQRRARSGPETQSGPRSRARTSGGIAWPQRTDHVKPYQTRAGRGRDGTRRSKRAFWADYLGALSYLSRGYWRRDLVHQE